VPAERFGQVARTYWPSRTSLHWTLDIFTNEDQARNPLDNGPNNLAATNCVELLPVRRSPTDRRRDERTPIVIVLGPRRSGSGLCSQVPCVLGVDMASEVTVDGLCGSITHDILLPAANE
jgi:hypothetical protein